MLTKEDHIRNKLVEFERFIVSHTRPEYKTRFSNDTKTIIDRITQDNGITIIVYSDSTTKSEKTKENTKTILWQTKKRGIKKI